MKTGRSLSLFSAMSAIAAVASIPSPRTNVIRKSAPIDPRPFLSKGTRSKRYIKKVPTTRLDFARIVTAEAKRARKAEARRR